MTTRACVYDTGQGVCMCALLTIMVLLACCLCTAGRMLQSMGVGIALCLGPVVRMGEGRWTPMVPRVKGREGGVAPSYLGGEGGGAPWYQGGKADWPSIFLQRRCRICVA